MKPTFRLFFLLWTISFSAQVASAQITSLPHQVNLKNEVKALWQKSNTDVPSNFTALPILKDNKKKNALIPFFKGDGEELTSEILLGDGAEVYLLLSDFELGPSEVLIISSKTASFTQERYTSKHNRESKQLLIGPYRGDVTLDLTTTREISELKLYQAFANPINVGHMALGFDASFDCHVNINCEAGSQLADIKRSVMRIRMVAEEGVALCTGTLLNNTKGDRKPYVLTAYHCLVPPEGTITPLFDLWWFDFNYESFSCANPEDEPFPFQIQGAERVAEWEDTDMMLLKITDDIPNEANVYFAGWNREDDYVPDTTYLIHHPVGDIKKISVDVEPAVIHDKRIGWNNGSNSPELTHYLNDFDETTYEPGSSGAAIFDQNGSVLGQLHGGPLSDEFCSIGIGYSGRVSVSWDSGDAPEDRLKDWLDPLDFNSMSIPGINPKLQEVARVTGAIVTPDGLAIPDVRVSLVGDLTASFLTGNDGRFVFENLDPEGQYTISLEKNTSPSNGLTATDLVILRNHIVGRNLIDHKFTLLSGDVSGDNAISSVDLVQIRNLIIGRQDRFPNKPSWDFEPKVLEMDMGSANANGEIEVMVIGYKVGDVNYSANPKR